MLREVAMDVMVFSLDQNSGKDFLSGVELGGEHEQKQQRWESTRCAQKRGWGSIT